MSTSPPEKATVYARGSVKIGYLQDEYQSHIAREDTGEPNPEDELIHAYFDYHVTRLINLYLLSRSSGLDDLTSMLEMIIRLAFKIMLARGRDELKACDDIRVDSLLGHVAIEDSKGAHFTLGNKGESEPGFNMILGASTSEEIPRLEMTVEVSSRQLEALRSHPEVLRHVMNNLEDAVPLNLDYSLGFRVTSEDCSFRLAAARPPMLGITTALGMG
jgi:hypothetical protein